MSNSRDRTLEAEPEFLRRWGEIATYLGKGVRTVQRWEREMGLPVHRLHQHEKESVFALRSELQQWAHGFRDNLPNPTSTGDCGTARASCVIDEIQRQRQRLRELRSLLGASRIEHRKLAADQEIRFQNLSSAVFALEREVYGSASAIRARLIEAQRYPQRRAA